MADGAPAEVVPTSLPAALVGSVPSLPALGFVAILTLTVGLVLGAVSGVGVVPGVGGAFAIVGVLSLTLFGAVWFGREVRFHRDRVESASPYLGGRSLDYDDVEVVVRRSVTGDGVGGAESFLVFGSDGDTVEYEHLADSDAVERAFADRVPTPRERIGAAEDDPDHGYFWRYWPEELAVPRTAVLDQSELEDRLGVTLVGTDFGNLPAYAQADEFEDLTDIEDARSDPEWGPIHRI